jgi:hypothetical protein
VTDAVVDVAHHARVRRGHQVHRAQEDHRVHRQGDQRQLRTRTKPPVEDIAGKLQDIMVRKD